MQRSEQIGQLAGALAKAQGQMRGAIKDAQNPYFKSSYSDLASIIDAIRKPLADNNLSYVQLARSNEHGVEVETILMHGESGQWISETLALPVAKQESQPIGSAITYAKRYGLQAMVGVPSEDDDGNAAMTPSPAKKTVRETVTPRVQKWVTKLADNPDISTLNTWLPELTELEPAEKTSVKNLILAYGHKNGWSIPKGSSEFIAGAKS